MSSRLRTRLRAGTGLSTPSLSLEFQTATGALDPRVTFSRTSQATLVDSTGKLTYALNNLLTNSQDFEAAGWAKTNSSVTANSAVAPDGTTTADSLIENSATGQHYMAQSVAVLGSAVFSVYVKPAGRSWVELYLGTATGFAFFDVANGVVGATGAGTTATITSVGNGWYRCAIAGAAAGTLTRGIYLANANNSDTYAGNGTSGVLVWGAQLEQVTYQTTPGTYNSTSPKNLLGYTQEFDNAAWTKSNSFVQTNLLTYSEAFDNAAWIKTNTTISSNALAGPSGTLTADSLLETAVNDIHRIYQGLTVASATGYTWSGYVKSNGRSIVQLVCSATSTVYTAEYNISAETATNISGSGSATITPVGDGWYRITATATSTGAGLGYWELRLCSASGVTSYTGDVTKGLYIWGAQLVQGSTAGDYQRTDAAAAAVQYVAPDGSRTADKLVEDATNNQHSVYRLSTTMTAGAKAVLSLYAKNDGRRYIVVYPQGPGAANAAYAIFDLQTGAVSSTGGAQYISSSITDSGNGWYRCAVSFNVTDPSVHSVFYLSNSSSVASPTYTGDGTSGIYIWGAQLSNSASLDPYVYNPVAAPTSAAYYGPRFDYDPVTLANKGLLIEEQRTNLLTYSQQLDDATWIKSNVTISANAVVAPDGTVTADLATPTASGFLLRTFATASGTTYAVSVYAKSGGTVSRLDMGAYAGSDAATVAFNVITGTFISQSTAGTGVVSSYSITPVGSGWYKCVVVFSGVATANIPFSPVYNAAQSGGIYLWGAQLEAGSFATSYIPTVASQVTRTADVALMQGANFSNWYNQNEGTLFEDATWVSPAVSGYSYYLSISEASGINNLISLTSNSGAANSRVRVGAVDQANFIPSPAVNLAGINIKQAISCSENNFNYVINGGTALTDNSGSMPPSVTQLHFNLYSQGARHIRRIGYYPTRLANEQLQSLTAQSTIPSLSLDFTTQVFNVG